MSAPPTVAVPADTSSADRRRRADRQVILLLATLLAFMPLSTDLLLPSMPGIGVWFDVDAGAVQADAAAAMTGFVHNVSGALVGWLVGRLHDGSVLPMAEMVAMGGLGAWLVARTLVHRHGGVDRLPDAPLSGPGAPP
jgi:hypothetical protein